ncbi:MmpS family transport accessory protein [Lentzea kentuckyensis]|uniref:MmpS family transport accessory protein n=1 Tax=Lentzea kentuckyensis TaxID=360086 RepID=UPI001179E07F|nr:MmpS family transport accessory protein [Lentzea kentuckyensis]
MSSGMPPEYGLAPPLHEVPRAPKWPWVLFLIVALLAVGGAVYGPRVVDAVQRQLSESAEDPVLSVRPQPSPPTAPGAAKKSVVFEVTGTGKAFTITATVGSSVQNPMNVPLPWTHTIEVPAGEPSASVMLVVVAGPDGAEVHGKYTIDGRTVREGKASGPYGVLTITDS